MEFVSLYPQKSKNAQKMYFCRFGVSKSLHANIYLEIGYRIQML